MLRVSGMESDDVGSIVALDEIFLSWFDLLPCTNHSHTHRHYCHKSKSFKDSGRYTVAAVLLLYAMAAGMSAINRSCQSLVCL